MTRSKIELMLRAVAVAFLLFALVSFSCAQRGGRGSVGGGMHSFAGGHSATTFRAAPFRAAPVRMARGPSGPFISRQNRFAPRFAPVTRSSFVRSRASATRRFPQRSVITFGHINGGPFFNSRRDFRFNHFHHFHSPFFFAFPFYGYGAYWDDDSLYNQYWNPYYSLGPYSYDPNMGTSSYTDLSSQLGDLSLQLQDLRDQNESLRSELQETQTPSPPAAVSSTPANAPTTILVFNDGHQRAVQNYAIVGQTLWILSDTRSTKVPLAELNLNQTIKTNEDRGVEFLGPATRQ